LLYNMGPTAKQSSPPEFSLLHAAVLLDHSAQLLIHLVHCTPDFFGGK
jgi:hypothetical protein